MDPARDMDSALVPPLNKRGQHLGAKGERTRRRIMAATAELLKSKHPWEITVSDICRATGTAQSNFYTYFESIHDVILQIAEDVSEESIRQAAHLEGDWRGSEGLAHARRLVKATIDIWRAHGAVLRVVNALSEDHDEAFLRARYLRNSAMLAEIESKIREGQAAGYIHPEIHPKMASYTVMTLLDGIGARTLMGIKSIDECDIVETTARFIHLLVTGQPRLDRDDAHTGPVQPPRKDQPA